MNTGLVRRTRAAFMHHDDHTWKHHVALKRLRIHSSRWVCSAGGMYKPHRPPIHRYGPTFWHSVPSDNTTQSLRLIPGLYIVLHCIQLPCVTCTRGWHHAAREPPAATAWGALLWAGVFISQDYIYTCTTVYFFKGGMMPKDTNWRHDAPTHCLWRTHQ